jgi:hypothetical protein
LGFQSTKLRLFLLQYFCKGYSGKKKQMKVLLLSSIRQQIDVNEKCTEQQNQPPLSPQA